MSIAGTTSTSKRQARLAVVRELQRDRNVFSLAQRFDDELQGVLVLARDAELVALDPDLDLVRDVLDALPQIASEVVVDTGVQVDLDLAAALADRLGIAGLEELGRQLPPGRL